MTKKILIVAAHPDDEILGCGGTVARLVKEGCEAFTLILGEGKTSRDKVRNVQAHTENFDMLQKEAISANSIIGVKDVYFHNFPDNRFDSVALIDVIKVVEKYKNEIKPDIIFTHYENDCNVDHNITYRAVMTATRPLKDETVKSIYSFEVMSSTEWRFPICFSPNTFYNVSDTLDQKIKAMNTYASELCKFPHPRSGKGIELCAANWGMKIGCVHAEAFKLIRQVC